MQAETVAVEAPPDPAQLIKERLAKEEARRAQLERLLKRAGVITTALRKFIAEWTTARQAELDAARAAAAAKAGGKKKGKKKEAKKKEPAGKDGKKKAPKTPVAEAWSNMMSAMDELVNKNKRVNLEDMYRGTEMLSPSELCTLRNIMATANKKVFPTDGMNLNQLNVKNALWAAAAAHEYAVVDRALAAPALGLAAVRDKGVGARQLLELGYREGDLLRAGFSHEDVCEVSNHDPARLRAAGLSAAEVVAGCSRGGGVGGLPAGLQGFRGVQRLRAAGYSATELVAAGLDNAWDLRQAGFSAAEVFTAGVPAEALRPAGYGVPELQPATFLGPSFAPLQDSDPRLLPSPLEGTRGGIWPRMLQTQPPALTLKDAGRSGGGAGVSGGGGLGATSRLAATGMRTARAAPAASTASASPAGTGVQGLADQLPARNVGWGEAGSALPAAPGLSRTGSAAGSVRSGTLGM
ncbi:hypothetical protein CHLRE_06g270800v5 [Chlamydomonas reinhardtii]|uniref:Uncharacterized protein n=1 Tax=Chlamydomonas reinhardtii TaxID=3055 RepID=A0A2K3DNB3_CHLRE|nr:uncharacterized protein CHLRE_06g270800v5 [Chlamydomonas reinhardtii]PNW82029.1 hypothetical protein CHLRE_06g270800v5 [Chlamydomonas reinhardtii]